MFRAARAGWALTEVVLPAMRMGGESVKGACWLVCPRISQSECGRHRKQSNTSNKHSNTTHTIIPRLNHFHYSIFVYCRESLGIPQWNVSCAEPSEASLHSLYSAALFIWNMPLTSPLYSFGKRHVFSQTLSIFQEQIWKKVSCHKLTGLECIDGLNIRHWKYWNHADVREERKKELFCYLINVRVYLFKICEIRERLFPQLWHFYCCSLLIGQLCFVF